jgi:alpha-aminoadipic semialdehyde synthase
LLHHAFKLKTPGSDREQTVTASLLCYGTDEGSAMSITVGKTLAFAALRVLDGHVKGRGVKGPYEREVWEGVLQSLEEVGVRVEEKWE